MFTRNGLSLSFLFVSLLALPFLGDVAAAASDKPERSLVAAFEYPVKTIVPDGKFRVDLVLRNRGRKDETVFFEPLSKPDGWKVKIEKFGSEVGGVFVPAGESKTLSFLAEYEGKAGRKEDGGDKDGEKLIPPGRYSFSVRVQSEDGKLVRMARAQAVVKKEETSEKGGGENEVVRISTSYPSLRGSTESDFKFSVDIHNDCDEDQMFHLRADAPKGWRVSFKPSYENKYIASLKIDANLSKTIDVEIDPPADAEQGKQKIVVWAECSKGKAYRELEVELTGTHKMICRTLDDLLSVAAQQGDKANLSIYVKNIGTARLENIEFSTFKPENWKVEFKPEKIPVIEPNEMKQVEVTISTADQALVGDYSVAITAREGGGGRAQDDIELRVTVRASTMWAWIGVAVIIAVLLGLSTVFNRWGRR